MRDKKTKNEFSHCIWARPRALTEAEMRAEEPVMVDTFLIERNIPFPKCTTNISCYKFPRPNQYAKDCHYWPPGTNGSRQQVVYFQRHGLGHIVTQCLGKREGGNTSVSVYSHETNKSVGASFKGTHKMGDNVLCWTTVNWPITLTLTHSDMREQMLKEWQQRRPKFPSLTCARINCKCAYTSLLPFRMVIFNGCSYCLTWTCFELNVTPAIMKSVLDARLSEDSIRQATSA